MGLNGVGKVLKPAGTYGISPVRIKDTLTKASRSISVINTAYQHIFMDKKPILELCIGNIEIKSLMAIMIIDHIKQIKDFDDLLKKQREKIVSSDILGTHRSFYEEYLNSPDKIIEKLKMANDLLDVFRKFNVEAINKKERPIRLSQSEQ
ncbi:MAG: hypothetical protein NT030_04400 [Candidatus Saganbacteria bacterium]|nr:hypothetical protein [Candidatus Saganbacteria bacterium]